MMTHYFCIFSRKAKRRLRTSSGSGVACPRPARLSPPTRPSPPTRFPVPGISPGIDEVAGPAGRIDDDVEAIGVIAA